MTTTCGAANSTVQPSEYWMWTWPRARNPTCACMQRSVPNASLERHAQRFRELRRGLEQIEYFCKGTVLKRMMKCGKARCACASDPTKRHGPYFELTYNANGKTVNVKLSPEAKQLPCLRPQPS